VGFVDKRTESDRYLDLVGECDMGCLLSRAEAGGIGLREFHALGLAVLGPDVGGAPDHAIAGASLLVRPEATDEAIAALLVDLARQPERVEALRAASWTQRRDALWETTVEGLLNIRAKFEARCDGGQGQTQ